MSEEKCDVYQIVTDRIVGLLEQGVIPWKQPWCDLNAPSNLVSKKTYRGINLWLLGACGFSSSYWLSFKQAKDLGGSVKKGESSSIAVFWKRFEKTDKETGEKSVIPMLRYYRVFNVTQCEDIEYPKPVNGLEFNPIERAETLCAGYPNPPKIESREQCAFYRRSLDVVNVPAKPLFASESAYYNVLFHELTHSTGHESRIGRLQDSTSGFGSTSYAKEELIAEMGAAYLSGISGFENDTIDNSAAYIQNWLKALKDDRKLVVSAAGAAQRAVDHITGKTFETEAN